MTKQQKNNNEEMLRSVALYRVKGDTQGKLPNERFYRPHDDSPVATIPELMSALANIYDLVVLHDPYDGCLLLNLQKDAPESERVTKLPCKLHPTL